MAVRPCIHAALWLEGEYWTVTFSDSVLRLRDNKGLRYLSWLLGHPGVEIGVSTLMDNVSPERLVPPTEDIQRARSAVTKRIRDAIARIEHHHVDLGRHLRATVRTGARCVYRPDPVAGVFWRVQ